LEISAERTISEELKDSLSFINTFKDYNSLKKEVDTLAQKLERLGYIESKLQDLNKKNDSTYLANYFFGKKHLYIKVYYDNTVFSRKELQEIAPEITETYFILPFETAENSLQKLNALKTEDGNAFATLSLANLKPEENYLSATLEFDSGKKRILDSIVIKGYEKFPRSFLKYYAGVKTGKTFSKKKIKEQNTTINSLGFTRTIKAPEVLFRKETTTAYFYLEKQNNNLFDGILGFATDEETQKLQFNGYLNLELNNNLNYGEQLLINYKADGSDQQNFRVKATLPYLFKTPFGISAELKIFKRDSTFVTTEQQARVNYQVNPASTAYAGYKAYESSNLLDDVVIGNTVEDFNSRFFISGASFLKLQDDILFPVKTELTVETEIGERELEGINENQFKLLVTASSIFNLNYSNSIFVKNNTKILFSETYIVNELFRFGGINSIRGFNENSIDASLLSTLNTEYRYRFNKGLYIHSIIDFGYFQNQVLDLKESLYSAGIGIGLQTKAGILRLNIANGISENQDFNFSNTKIHVSLTSRF
jgi:outer membrane translocation and assembly module TamA|tara:strand:- start:60484 stop:62097 length:1614 start_codon:yes stop_codon:yes gene_type:complete